MEDLISAIKERLNIVDVVGRYVQLRQVGSRWVAPCPFHQETKPSFNVHPEKGFFYCFGCQAAGDVISFYQRINGLEFKEAIKDLAREAGLDLSRFRSTKESSSKKAEFLELHQLAAEFFVRNLGLEQGKKARDYLLERKISVSIQKEFRLGYSLDQWHALESFFEQKKIAKDKAIACGLLVKNEKGQIYDRFRDRLMFPIFDYQGRVVAFGARTLGDADPKYLNSKDSLIYKKGEHLYGFFQAKPHIVKLKEAILTEGYIDVLSLCEAGFKNACAILGTSLTEAQVFRLAQITSKIVLLLDGDSAGQKAALRSAEMLLVKGLECRVVVLPDNEDADSFVKKFGAKALQNLLDNSLDGLDYCLNLLKRIKSPQEQLKWVEEFLNNVADFKLKAFYVPKLAYGLGLSETELRQGLQSFSQKKSVNPAQAGFVGWEKDVLELAIVCPDKARSLAELGVSNYFKTEKAKALWEKILEQVDLNELEPDEKAFVIQVKMMREEHILKEQDVIWQGIVKWIEQKKMEMHLKNLRKALDLAYKQGDQEEVTRLLALYTSLVRQQRGCRV